MKLAVKVTAHLMFVCSLVVFYALPRNKYSWMQDIDPTMTALPIDHSADSRLIFTGTVLAVTILAQLLITVLSTKRMEKLISLGLIVIAVGIWLFKYW